MRHSPGHPSLPKEVSVEELGITGFQALGALLGILAVNPEVEEMDPQGALEKLLEGVHASSLQHKEGEGPLEHAEPQRVSFADEEGAKLLGCSPAPQQRARGAHLPLQWSRMPP